MHLLKSIASAKSKDELESRPHGRFFICRIIRKTQKIKDAELSASFIFTLFTLKRELFSLVELVYSLPPLVIYVLNIQ
jgi:hypothetical protein